MPKPLLKIFSVLILVISLLSIFPNHAVAVGTGIWVGTKCSEEPTDPIFKQISGTSVGGPVTPCDFCDGMIVVSNIIRMLTELAFAISVLMIIYGAGILILSGGSEERVGKGKKIIGSAVTGLAIALVSWLIVETLLRAAVSSGSVWAWSDITCNR